MLLDKKTRSIKVKTSVAPATSPLVFSAEFVDTKREATYPGATIGNFVETFSEVIPVPDDNASRDILELIFYNADTASAIVIVEYDDNGTGYVLKKSTLTAGQSLTYQKNNGWQVN